MSDGVAAAVSIRALERRDRPALAFTFAHLSERSRQQRYLAVKLALSDAELSRLVAVDHWHHEALIAFSPAPRAPVAVAHYVRTERFDVAEIAVEVVDEWQRRRIGEALLGELRARALAAGIRRFHATMLWDNPAAAALARRLGPATVSRAGDGILELDVSLAATLA